MESLQSESEQHQLIQLAAYYLWQRRGSPLGTSGIDWFDAEQQLYRQSEYGLRKPALISAAETVGSALGAVAEFVSSIGG